MTDTSDITLATLLDSIPRDELARVIARRGRVGQSAFLEALYLDLDSAIERLEANAHRAQSDGEEKLTNYLAVQLAAARLACTSVEACSRQATFSSAHDHPSGFKLLVRHYGVLLIYDPQA